MSLVVPVRIRDTSRRSGVSGAIDQPIRSSALVRFMCFALFFFPSTMVIEPIGASSTVPLMLAMVLLLIWVASGFWGLHDPTVQSSPQRLAVGVLVIGILAAYAAMYGGWSGDQTAKGLASADRWVILAFASLSMVMVVSDTIHSLADAMEVARWLLAGAFFGCVVGVVQFVFQINPMDVIQQAMPGFVDNGGDTPFQQRGALVRVAGSTFHSIEFAVTSVMLLPLSIWRAMFDPRGSKTFHWVQTGLLVFAVAATVSRSGTLATVIALVTFLPFLPGPARRRVLTVLPFAVLALFMAVPGFIGTLTGALTADTSDPSIATRVNNYPRILRLIQLRPLFGTGPGTYLPKDALQILDNQYLNSAVSVGIIGAACVAFYLVVPGVAALFAATKARSAPLRCLSGALAAGLLVAAVCSATFDSLSFPVFALLFPIVVGFAGAAWRLVADDIEPPFVPPSRPSNRRV